MVADSVVAWGVEVTRVASKNVKINQEDAKADLGNCVVSTTYHFTLLLSKFPFLFTPVSFSFPFVNSIFRKTVRSPLSLPLTLL